MQTFLFQMNVDSCSFMKHTVLLIQHMKVSMHILLYIKKS